MTASETKNCPFCKKTIDKSLHSCPHCKRILAEKIEDSRFEQAPHSDKKEKLNISEKFHLSLWVRKLLSKNKYIQFSLIGLVVLILVSAFAGGTKEPTKILPKLDLPTTQAVKLPPLPRLNQDSPQADPAPINGTTLYKNTHYFNGEGKLSVTNGTNYDTVLKLVSHSLGKSVFNAYIRANSIFTISSISDGIYDVYFASGSNWSNDTKSFSSGRSISKFRDPFDFSTTEEERADGIYSVVARYEITLNPVVGGTAKTDDINASEFNQL